MRILTKEEYELDIEGFRKQILKGEIIIYPTDTIYGIGCDATNKEAVHKIRELKKRLDMPFSVIAPTKEWIKKNCEISKEIGRWIEKLPGPITLILKLKNKDAVADNVAPGMDTIGVRIPQHWFTETVKKVGIPIITTSANIAGENFMTKIEDLSLEMKEGAKIIIYEGEKKGRPSNIINLTKEKIGIKKR